MKEINDREQNCQTHFGRWDPHPPDWWNNKKLVAALRRGVKHINLTQRPAKN